MSKRMRRLAGVGTVAVGFAVCVTVGLPGVLLMLFGIWYATDEPEPARARRRGC
jgi:hypothetical protein